MEQTKQSEEAVKEVWNDEFFLLFMAKRLPQETDKAYIREWKSRFMTGNPFGYMDKESIQAYKEAVEEYTRTRICALDVMSKEKKT